MTDLAPLLVALHHGLHIYLSGPRAGHRLLNAPAFTATAALLRSLGARVTTPHEIAAAHGFDPCVPEVCAGATLGCILEDEVAAVIAADLVLLLDGWETSACARTEVTVAQAAGIPVAPVADVLAVLGERSSI